MMPNIPVIVREFRDDIYPQVVNILNDLRIVAGDKVNP
jgi:hypothetical protein